MAKLEYTPLFEYMKELSKLGSSKSEEIMKEAIYEGAKIIADEIKEEMKSLPAVNHGIYDAAAGRSKITITEEEKKDIINAFGISKMRYRNWTWDVKVGFDGYGSKPTRTHPNGVPIPLTVRSIISGASYRYKNDFINRAVKRSRKKAVNKMNEVVNKKIEKEMRNDG